MHCTDTIWIATILLSNLEYDLDTAWKPSSIYSITGRLKFWPKEDHSFSFYDHNKYKPLANYNPIQYLKSWIYQFKAGYDANRLAELQKLVWVLELRN